MASRFTKPPPGAQINWSHPLAQGLVGAWIFNEGAGTPIDLARRAGQSSMSGTVWRPSIHGLAVEHTAITNFLILSAEAANWLPTANISIAFRRRKTDGTNRPSGAIGTETAVDADKCNFLGPYSDGVYYWDFGGSGGVNRLSYSPTSVSDNSIVLTAGAQGMEIWRNGVREALSGTAVSRSESAAGKRFGLNFFYTPGTDQGDLAQDIYLYLYDWQIGSLGSQLHAEPYDFLLLQSPRSYFYGAIVSAAGKSWLHYARQMRA